MEQEQILDRLHHLLKSYLAEQKQGRFVDYRDPADLSEILNLDTGQNGADWAQIFDWIEKYLAFSVKTGHPGFLNRMWAGANLPSILGEVVTAVSNTSACTYESAPVSTVMEQYMLDQMLDLVGFTNGEAQMTTGSSNANLLAMMAARNTCQPGVKAAGLFSGQPLTAFVSADAHYSMEKAANVLGLGTDSLIKTPVNARGEMDMTILADQLAQAQKRSSIPFFVAGTAGTTVRGAYDPIKPLLDLRDRYGFWLHMDGAWGGAVILSDRLRQRFLAGIEQVDSFCWDFHKMPGTALICNVFLINNRPHTLGRVCSSGDDSYIFHTTDDNRVRDLGAVSLQCGRRVDSLKWFLDWKFFGKAGFARMVEHGLDLCRYAEQRIRQSDHLELVYPRNTFNVCFRYKPTRAEAGPFNLALRNTLYHQGKSLVGYARNSDGPFLRLLLASHDLDENDVDHYFSQLIETGKDLEKEYR
ncbi:MAG: pyridoxal-dependent decarboxylase [Desulfotignum sp.]|nr:pyridoxal-dependent decarboxylase [Desulfotignum sp.]